MEDEREERQVQKVLMWETLKELVRESPAFKRILAGPTAPEEPRASEGGQSRGGPSGGGLSGGGPSGEGPSGGAHGKLGC